ncbi:hypothetical protein SAMN05216313_11356 [Enterocloster lavalensis]|uniref:Uncharacterized protein n=1 Tax=Enterocloster lavalensis TaxID=460384 RepID=A0A1I0GV11_9FIRM|nr:hypothetical protein SAMN05216313_11356 [Enterocloster lavalensis]
MKDYTTLKEGCLTPAALQDVPGFCRRFGLEGIEVFYGRRQEPHGSLICSGT